MDLRPFIKVLNFIVIVTHSSHMALCTPYMGQERAQKVFFATPIFSIAEYHRKSDKAGSGTQDQSRPLGYAPHQLTYSVVFHR
jgi:hypothetical protein